MSGVGHGDHRGLSSALDQLDGDLIAAVDLTGGKLGNFAVIAVWFMTSWVCMHLQPKPPIVSERDRRCGRGQGSTAMTARNQPAAEDSLDAITDALLTASRLLVAISARLDRSR